MITARYFKESEFQKCVPACSLQDMNQDAMNFIDRMREIAGVPIILNSTYRSPEWEKAKGRSGTGAHTTGRAFDIRCADDATRYALLSAAALVGCARIGIAKSYLHVDFSPHHAQNIIWLY